MEALISGAVASLAGRSAGGAAPMYASDQNPALIPGHPPELLDAFLTVSTGLDLGATLERIVRAAASLGDARYGALGVLRPDGRELDTLVTVGMDPPDDPRIGHLPHGAGILGRLITDPRPLRLTDLTTHPASVGMPAGHPPMRSFLGVPIRAHGRIFGNLYLTEKRCGEFSEEDELLLSALAAAAGVAIENTRSLAESELRRRWLSAGAEVRAVVDVFGVEAASQVAVDRALDLAEADGVWLLREVEADRHLFQVLSVAGPDVDDCTGVRVGPDDSPVLAAVPRDATVTIDLAEVPPRGPEPDGSWGIAIVAPLQGNDSGHGLLIAARRPGRPAFETSLGEMVGSFATQVAVALDAETRQQVVRRLDLLEERERIGRELHDHVLQRLFATGMGMQALAGSIVDRGQRDKLRDLVGQLDQTVRDIRTSVLDLASAGRQTCPAQPVGQRRVVPGGHHAADLPIRSDGDDAGTG